jgi:hypothetical protein
MGGEFGTRNLWEELGHTTTATVHELMDGVIAACYIDANV